MQHIIYNIVYNISIKYIEVWIVWGTIIKKLKIMRFGSY